jgi:hypothetical protein
MLRRVQIFLRTGCFLRLQVHHTCRLFTILRQPPPHVRRVESLRVGRVSFHGVFGSLRTASASPSTLHRCSADHAGARGSLPRNYESLGAVRASMRRASPAAVLFSSGIRTVYPPHSTLPQSRAHPLSSTTKTMQETRTRTPRSPLGARPARCEPIAFARALGGNQANPTHAHAQILSLLGVGGDCRFGARGQIAVGTGAGMQLGRECGV